MDTTIQAHQIEEKFKSLFQGLKNDYPHITVSSIFTVVRCSFEKIEAGLCTTEEIHERAKAKVKGSHAAQVENKKQDVRKQKMQAGRLLEMNFSGATVAIFVLSEAVPKEFAQKVGMKLTEKKATSSQSGSVKGKQKTEKRQLAEA